MLPAKVKEIKQREKTPNKQTNKANEQTSKRKRVKMQCFDWSKIFILRVMNDTQIFYIFKKGCGAWMVSDGQLII